MVYISSNPNPKNDDDNTFAQYFVAFFPPSIFTFVASIEPQGSPLIESRTQYYSKVYKRKTKL